MCLNRTLQAEGLVWDPLPFQLLLIQVVLVNGSFNFLRLVSNSALSNNDSLVVFCNENH